MVHSLHLLLVTWDITFDQSETSYRPLLLILQYLYYRASLIHFACIVVALPSLFKPQANCSSRRLEGEQLQCRKNGSTLIYLYSMTYLYIFSEWCVRFCLFRRRPGTTYTTADDDAACNASSTSSQTRVTRAGPSSYRGRRVRRVWRTVLQLPIARSLTLSDDQPPARHALITCPRILLCEIKP